jgi:hypothetical protein
MPGGAPVTTTHRAAHSGNALTSHHRIDARRPAWGPREALGRDHRVVQRSSVHISLASIAPHVLTTAHPGLQHPAGPGGREQRLRGELFGHGRSPPGEDLTADTTALAVPHSVRVRLALQRDAIGRCARERCKIGLDGGEQQPVSP